MAHNDVQGKVIGEIWRAQESAKEITYFTVEGQPNWFRIEYIGDMMLERANYMAERLKTAANGNSGIEVGVDFDSLVVEGKTFNLVRYIQIKG